MKVGQFTTCWAWDTSGKVRKCCLNVVCPQNDSSCHKWMLDSFAGPEEGGGAGPSSWPRRDQEQGGGAGLRKLNFFGFSCYSTAVLQKLSLWLLCTTAETAIAWYTSCCAMARGHCLNILVALAAVHGLLGLPGRCARSSHSLFLPPRRTPPPRRPRP